MLVRIFLFITLWLATLPTDSQTQQSIPDYVGQAPADVHNYYPQYEDYFKTIFDDMKELKPRTIALLNEEIHENMILFEDDIKSEKDKRTIVLMALELLVVGKKHFTNAKDVQGPQGDNDYKFLIAEEIETSATERAQKNREQAIKNHEQAIKNHEQAKKNHEQAIKNHEQAKKEHDRVKAKNAKLEEVIALINRLNEEGSLKAEIEKVLNGLEDYFALYNDEELEAELKQNQGVVKIIEWYIAFNKKLDRTPSALGQKIINEYNKYQK